MVPTSNILTLLDGVFQEEVRERAKNKRKRTYECINVLGFSRLRFLGHVTD